MNILHDPTSVSVGASFVKGGSDRQLSRDPLHGLVKEAGVARSEAPDKVVRAALKRFGVLRFIIGVP